MENGDTDEVVVEAPPAPAGLIYSKLVAVMRDVGAVPKGQQATHGDRYRYRGIDDVMQALHPALVRHGIIVIPRVEAREHVEYRTAKGSTMQRTLLLVTYRFVAEDGSSVDARVVGEGADVGDKSVNKALAGAMKYAITQALCIPTQEPKDSEADGPDLSGGRAGRAAATADDMRAEFGLGPRDAALPTSPEDRAAAFRELMMVGVPLLAEDCERAIGLADTMDQLNSADLIEHCSMLPDTAKKRITGLWARRRDAITGH